MIYEYYCKFCNEVWTVSKQVSRSGMPESCPMHHTGMEKLISSPGVSVGTFREGYSPAFGKVFTCKDQQDNEIRRVKGETGTEMVEVGNDNGFDKPELKKPDIGAAVRELRRHFNGRNN